MKLQPSPSSVPKDPTTGAGSRSTAEGAETQQRKGETARASHIQPECLPNESLPPIPSSNGLPPSKLNAPTSRHAKSTPPAMSALEQQHGVQQHRERRRSLFSSPSRSALGRASDLPAAASIDRVGEQRNAKHTDLSCLEATTVGIHPPERRRRKSFKDIFIPFSLKTSQVPQAPVAPHPPLSPLQADSHRRSQPRRRYSSASQCSSVSVAVSPTSPASIRKSTSTVTFSHSRHDRDTQIPPVPALPDHIPLASLSPIHSTTSKRPSSTYFISPQTPTTLASHQPQDPQSVKPTTSSAFPSLHYHTSTSRITKSPSVTTLYASNASTPSPASSAGTIATLQTIDLRSPTPSLQHTAMRRSQTNEREKSNSKKNQQEPSPLLLGPCFGDALLSSDTLHTAEILRVLHDRQEAVEEIESEDGYGSDDNGAAMSAESGDYGTASSVSHETGAVRAVPLLLREKQIDDGVREWHVEAQASQEAACKGTGRRSNPSNTLRVDTSLATNSPVNAPNCSSAYFSSNTSLASSSPAFHSSATSPTHQISDLPPPHASSTIVYRRTPTPTSTAVSSSSPKGLSQGAKLCLDYTMLRLKRDGSSSASGQPEKVNLLQWGGRRYPSSTRRLPRVPLNICSSDTEDNVRIQASQLVPQGRIHHHRREPRSTDLYRELAWIGIIRKLQQRKRLTLVEEVELDSFKKLKGNWTPCSSPLSFEFQLASTTARHIDTSAIKEITSGAPPSSKSKSPTLRNNTAQVATHDTTQLRMNPSAQPAPMTQASQSVIPPLPPTTSALVSGAFLTAQRSAWQKWLTRLPYEQRVMILLPSGEPIQVVPEHKGQLAISDRVYAWACAVPEDTEPSQLQEKARGAVNVAVQQVHKTETAENTALSNVDSRDDFAAQNVPAPVPAIAHVKVEGENGPFMRNRLSAYVRRTSSSDDAASTQVQGHSKASSSTSDASMVANNKNRKNGFGLSLVARLGFRSVKSKAVSSASETDRGSFPARKDAAPGSSSASSIINTFTPKSTPTTSASSACSDQTDMDFTLKAEDFTGNAGYERANLRPPREQKPLSMARSAPQGTSLSHLSTSYSALSENQPVSPRVSPVTNSLTDPSLAARPCSTMPKSQSEQRLSCYSARGAPQDRARRVSILEPPVIPSSPERRVRVLSQPEVLASRPHSMYVQQLTPPGHEVPQERVKERPASQFLETSQPNALGVSGNPAYHTAHRYSDPQVRTLSSFRDSRLDRTATLTDDDETPLAVLRRNSRTPPGLPPSSSPDQGLAEPRPHLRSAMRSSSQARPVSMLASANRNSMITLQEPAHMSRSASPPSNRLPVHGVNARHRRDSWHKGEDTLKSLIREEKLKQEREVEEINRRREQRKNWEDHRRRSVYLDEQAAAAEKAANEANRRQSQLYMSMALAQPQPLPNIQPILWTNGMQHAPYGIQQPQYLAPTQTVYQSRPSVMHNRPTSYHQNQSANGHSYTSYGQHNVHPYHSHVR